MVPRFLVILAFLLSFFLSPSPAQAGGVVGICDEAHLKGALAGGGVVTFSCSGTITLTSTITIAADTTIDGSGQQVTISGDNAVRVFEVNRGTTLNLIELAVVNGKSDYGGGIYSSGGTLTVSNSTFSENSAFFGGGISTYNGYLTVSNSTFSGNSAETKGGGIYTRIGPTVVNGKSDSGGGILNLDYINVSNSTFSGNSAGSGGGIFSEEDWVTVSKSTFSENSADLGGGIAISSGELSVSNSTFSGNSAGEGAGIASQYGKLEVRKSTFFGNSAKTKGGAISSNADFVTVSDSTFSGNSAPDGGSIAMYIVNIYGYDTATVSNSTFSGNSATRYGGSIYNFAQSLTVRNSTFSTNRASIAGGSIYNETDELDLGTINLGNTIVTNSLTGENCAGTITNGGGNLTYGDDTCPGIHSDPLLGPLQDNGGPTHTMALGAGSPAIDAAVASICASPPVDNLDQRGVKRPVDGDGDGQAVCDIGSFEYQPLAPIRRQFYLPMVWKDSH